MVDFHTHILPAMDDGAKTVEESIALLKMEIADGIDTVVLTPHFNYERQKLDAFLERRQQSFDVLQEACVAEGLPIQLLLGAEVRCTAWLREEEAQVLRITEDGLILVELPTSHCPPNVEDTIYRMCSNGLIPLLAHVERYPYLYRDPSLLYKWVSQGAFAQSNAEGILEGRETEKFILAGLKHNLIHVLSTDTHSLDKRPPRLLEALEHVGRRSIEVRNRLEKNAYEILDGYLLEPGECTPLKKWFGWR